MALVSLLFGFFSTVLGVFLPLFYFAPPVPLSLSHSLTHYQTFQSSARTQQSTMFTTTFQHLQFCTIHIQNNSMNYDNRNNRWSCAYRVRFYIYRSTSSAKLRTTKYQKKCTANNLQRLLCLHCTSSMLSGLVLLGCCWKYGYKMHRDLNDSTREICSSGCECSIGIRQYINILNVS